MFKKAIKKLQPGDKVAVDTLDEYTTLNPQQRIDMLRERFEHERQAAQQQQQMENAYSRLTTGLAANSSSATAATLGQLAGLSQGLQQWQTPKQTEVELCGIRFTEREIFCLHKLCEKLARQRDMETLPSDIDQAVKEAVSMLR